MKKLALLLICLALILGVGFASGAMAEGEPQLRLREMYPGGLNGVDLEPGETITVNRAVVPYDWQGEDGDCGYNYASDVCDFYIQDWDQLRDEYPDADAPEWSVEVQEGLELDSHFEVWEDGGRCWIWIGEGSRPQEPAQGRLTVTCTWLDQTVSAYVDLDFQNVELPKRVNFPTIIDVTKGQPADFVWNYDTEKFYWDVAWLDGFLVGNGEESFYNINDFFEWGITSGTLTLEPLDVDPGYYVWDMHIKNSGFDIHKDVLVRVHASDDSNSIPDPVMELSDHRNVTYFLPGYANAQGYETELCPGETCFIRPDNYLMLSLLYGDDYGDDYHWEFEEIEGLDIEFVMDDDCNANLTVNNFREVASGTTAKLNATLYWGDLHADCTFDLTFRDVVLPAQIDWPGDLVLTLDQDEYIEVNLDDNEWERERCLWYDFARYGREWAIEQECLNPEQTRLVGHETGVFAAIPHIHASNLFIYGPTARVVVKEEGGEEPDLILRFDDDACEDYTTTRAIFKDNEGIGLFHDSWVRNYVIEDYDIIKALIGGEPEWSVKPVGETHGALISGHIWGDEHDPDLRGFDVNIDNEPNEPCEIEYKVTCTWEGLEPIEGIEGNCTITYDYPPEIPDDLRLAVDDAYHGLQVNTEPFEIPISWQPDTFSFGQKRDFRVGFGCDYNGNNWWDWKDGVPTQFIEPHEPGVYQAWISAIWANIRLEKPIILYVADENGEVPGPEILLEDDRDVNRTFSVGFRDKEDVFTDNWVGNAVIENYGVLRALLEGGPEWSYKILEGDVEPEIHPWDDRRGADLNFETLPDEPCENRYVIRCEWGGLSVERTMSVSFTGDVQLPEGGTVDPVIRLKPGEPTRVDVDFNPSTFGIEDARLCYWFHDGDMMEYMDVEENTEERWVEFTPHEGVSGVFGGTLYICSGNVCAGRRDVAYVISEGEDDYPFEVHGGPNFEVMPILDQWWEGDYGSVDLHTEDVMANFWFDESYYEVMRDHLRCEPDWRYTQTGGDDIETELQLYDDDNNARGAMLLLRSMPEEPEDVTFKVTCSWGNYQFESEEFTIRFVDDIQLPESLNIENHIYMIAGEATEIPYTVTPKNWSIANDRHFDFWPVGGDDVDHDMWIDEEDGKLYARIDEPGLYVCCVFLREGSIVLPKRYVTFHVVAGEDEEYPELVFRFTDEAMYEPDNTFLIFEENEEIGMIRDAFVTRFEIENFYGMRALRAGDPKWTLEQLDHTDEVKLRAQNYFWEDRFDGLRGFEVFANKMPEEPIDAVHYRVRCEWGGEVIEALGELHYVVPDHLPTGVDIPDLIELKIDQENPIDLHFTFPEGFDFFDNDEYGYNANPRINIDWHDDFDREDWCEGHTLIINPHQCGEFHAWVGVTTCNLNFGKEVTFIVTGEDEPETLEVQGGPWFQDVAILNQFWEGDYGNTDLHTEDIMAEFFFPEDSYYARRAELGTTPEWHITRQGSDDIGEDFDFVLFDEGNNPRGATLCLRRMPEQPMEVTFTVTCDWGDYHYNSERESFTLRFVDTIPMPERLDIADVIDMNVGERTEVPYAVSPENWHCAEDRHFEVRVAGDQEYVDFHEDYDTENDKLYVTIDRPGTYSAIVFLREGSVVLPKRYVTFRVADRGGKAPRLRFEGDWMRKVHRTFARFEENEESALTHDNFVCDYCLDNSFEALWIQNKADPEWAVPQWDVTWEQTDGVTLSINNYDWEGEPWAHRGIQLFAEGMPDAACEVNYTVTCTWGDQSVSANGTVEYIDVEEMPTGVDIPDEIELDLNEVNAIDLNFVPDYFRFGENDRTYCEFYDEFERDNWDNGHTLYIEPHEPGVFAGRVGIISGNISIGKDVLFKVADDEYNTPEGVEPILWEYKDVYNIAIVSDNDDDVRGDGWIDDIGLKNPVAMRNAYGEVEWSVVQTEGEPLDPWTEYRDHGCAFFIDRQPTQPGTAKFIITGDWGDGVTVSHEYVLNIINYDLPSGAILYRDDEEIDEITMIAGETATITSAFVPDADWRLPDREDREGFDMWMDGVDNWDNPYFRFDGIEDDPFTVLLTAKQPGVYYLGSNTRSGNVLAYREIKVTVTDEKGDSGQIAPILENDFEMDIMLGELMDENNTGWLIRPNFWYMEPLNLRALREVYGDNADITWNVEVLGDEHDVGIDYETFEVEGVQNAGAEFRLTSMPAGPGTVVIRITTGWRSNGSDSDYMEASLEGTLSFISQPDNVPDTNTLPDRLYLRLGDTVEVEGYYPDGNWDVGQNFAWIGIGGVHVEEVYGNPHRLYLTGEQTGTWYGEALVGQHARGMTRKWITIMVYDDSDYTTMTLPAGLTEIGEEAFEGIAANRVIIPDGCQRIEARAFANCPYLREIHIPDSVWSIGDDVFDGCDDVVIITDNGVIQKWADNPVNDIPWFNE